MVSAGAELDRDGSGFYITFVVEEGELFKFGNDRHRVGARRPSNTEALRSELLTEAGTTFDQSQLDKTIERLTLAVSEQGFAFARVRPRAAREPGARLINVTYVIDEGPRIYIERINIIGNLRTHDYVVRREFRLAEGDAYNPLDGRQGQEAPAVSWASSRPSTSSAAPAPRRIASSSTSSWSSSPPASCRSAPATRPAKA